MDLRRRIRRRQCCGWTGTGALVILLAEHGRRREGKYFDTSDPPREKIAEVAQGSVADVDAAVKAAGKRWRDGRR